jgi:hypothetical protein
MFRVRQQLSFCRVSAIRHSLRHANHLHSYRSRRLFKQKFAALRSRRYRHVLNRGDTEPYGLSEKVLRLPQSFLVCRHVAPAAIQAKFRVLVNHAVQLAICGVHKTATQRIRLVVCDSQFCETCSVQNCRML